jgi:hypothetical protein
MDRLKNFTLQMTVLRYCWGEAGVTTIIEEDVFCANNDFKGIRKNLC